MSERYLGPMSEPAPGLEAEETFGKIPESRPELAEFFNEGWQGFNTPYSDVLRPLFFGYENKSEADLTVVDFGCGWGEHVTLAGIGFKSGDIPRVKCAVGLGVDEREIHTAQLLAKFAEFEPDIFRRIMQSSDICNHMGDISPSVAKIKNMLKNPQLSSELERLLAKGDVQEIAEFMEWKNYYPSFRSPQSPNTHFLKANLFHPPLPDNYADRIISSSVSSYIQDPVKEKAMWQSILRVIKKDGVINAISFEYERDGKLTSAPEQLQKTAEEAGIILEIVQKRDAFDRETRKNIRRQTIFSVIEK